MNLNNNQSLFTRLASIAGLISASFLLHLPAFSAALLQAETDSGQLTSGAEQLLAQSEGGDSGDNGDGDSGNSDGNGSDSDNGNGDSGDTDNGGSNGDDADNDNAGNRDGRDGDSGEVFGTRGGDTEGGAPYLGIGERPSDEDSFPQ